MQAPAGDNFAAKSFVSAYFPFNPALLVLFATFRLVLILVTVPIFKYSDFTFS